MKFYCIGLLLAMCSMAADLAEHPVTSKRTWIRRVTLASACAASLGFDSLTTRRAISAGAVESNAFLANAQGRPDWGRTIGIKAALCGASVYLEEHHRRLRNAQSDWTLTGVNVGLTAGYTWIGLHNLRLASDLQAKP